VADLATYVSRDGAIAYTGQDDLANDGEAGESDDVHSDVEWFYGGAGDDELTGTDNLLGGFNDLRGMMGDDTVFALAGNDWLDSHGSATVRSLNGENSEPLCVFVFAPTSEGAYSRMFAPEHGVAEDPATGSSTGPLAMFMIKHGLVAQAAGTRFVSEQGTKMQRRSRLQPRSP
jgi:Ca2+-binding RTX toxin-like protein